ncbi:hypothetical protein K469DRAFT_728199 [Zopfia rhizophila CBS 207.26]|uniref:Arrestin C-terminal-like domain-containing protein n=1 Tax=Zopfia rhizophila CBS 207.26 TaxID=1314779 RepID=A0A6A6DU02_9PEZI|nr:hypothetical protein K469DRAFT_728199 [Zopfia rhizophila CBS 207.26]
MLLVYTRSFIRPSISTAHRIWSIDLVSHDFLTEPSLVELVPQKLPSESTVARATSLSRKQTVASRHRPSIDGQRESNGIGSGDRGRTSRTPSPTTPAENSYSSIYSIPHGSVPPRSFSRARTRSASRPRQPPVMPPLSLTQRAPALPSLNPVPTIPTPPPRGSGNTIPRRGPSQPPPRQVAARLDPVSHDTYRRIPSRTFIRELLSSELLELPTHRHPRATLGSIEGTVQIIVDDAERIRHRRALDIARISIDLFGIEEMVGNRRSAFLNLATELIDDDNPPPHNMVDSQEEISLDDSFWHLKPSVTNLPFIMSLPLNVGPPFQSKNARIRYTLCVSLLIQGQGKRYVVRTSEDISVLSVYDPEKALVSLPSPLTASDGWIKPRDTFVEVVRVTAGLHRQVWVSGTSIYVDVHIVNNSRETIKKIELQPERDILRYKHAAASTMEKSASQARIFDTNERLILSKVPVRHGIAGWNGVPAHTTHMRTYDLEVPRGHATLVTVQLPIVLIHLNSLDVVSNSVAQVAAAIEEKRIAQTYTRSHSPPCLGRRPSQCVQGRTFAAPRMQSLEHMRAQEDLQNLGQILDHSPRKYSLRRVNSNWDYYTLPSDRKGRVAGDEDAVHLQRRLRHVRSSETVGGKATTLNRGNSMRSKIAGAVSVLGFKEAEAREDIELGRLALGEEGSFKSRLEQSRERQYRFGKKRSIERWKGVGVG